MQNVGDYYLIMLTNINLFKAKAIGLSDERLKFLESHYNNNLK